MSGIATVTKGGRVLRTVNSLTTNLYSSISCIKKLIYSTFLVHEDEEVTVYRDFKQQLRMQAKQLFSRSRRLQ